MTPTNGVTEPEIGTWVIRVGMFVIGFFLALGVKDAKKSLDEIPGLKARLEEMKDAQAALFRRVENLEGRK